MRPQTARVMTALGEEFRSAREARGLSLSDVAERLHIRSVYLAAIEDEDWKTIGPPVYVRGFMRTYARFLGLDAEAAVSRFSASVPSGTPAASSPRESKAIAEDRTGERSSPSLAAILALVVAVLAVGFVAYEFYQYRTGTPAAPVTDASGASAVADAASPDASPTDTQSNQPVAAAVPVPGVKPVAKRGLSLRVTETSWMRIAVDGKVVAEGTYAPGVAKSFAGKSADVRIGNAGGVKIAIDGKNVGPLGASGDVVERHFVLTGE